MAFSVNVVLLEKACAILKQHPRTFWCIGGACVGKSALCHAISNTWGFQVYDIDSHILGDFMLKSTVDRHPYFKQWMSADDPFAWLLALEDAEYLSFQAALTVEYLDLLTEDLRKINPEMPIIIDGGLSHPALLKGYFPLEHMVCLTLSDLRRPHMWDDHQNRQLITDLLRTKPRHESLLRKFLHFEDLLSHHIQGECLTHHIRTLKRTEFTTLNQLVAECGQAWRLAQPMSQSLERTQSN